MKTPSCSWIAHLALSPSLDHRPENPEADMLSPRSKIGRRRRKNIADRFFLAERVAGREPPPPTHTAALSTLNPAPLGALKWPEPA